MEVKEKLYTAEEFWDFCQLPENEGRRLELVNGEIIEDDMASKPVNAFIAIRIAHFLLTYTIPRGLGNVSGADGAYRLNDDIIRQPDVAFISIGRYPRVQNELMPPPELAVEIVSGREDIFKKTREYLYNGVAEVWAVYADLQELIVFNLDNDGNLANKRYGINDVLCNRAILPDFEMPIKDIFPLGYLKND